MNSPPAPADPSDGLQPLADLPPIFELDRIVSHVLADMGLGEATTTAEAQGRADFADFSVLHFLILPLRSVWLDFMLETDRKSAQQVFKIFSGVDETDDSDLADVLRETMNMIHGSLKAAFRQAGVDVIIPIVPQSIESDKLVGDLGGSTLLKRHLFRLAGVTLRLTMIARVAPITHKELKHFRLAEVLVDPINSAEGEQLAIVKKHTMLNKRLLEKVRGMAAFDHDASTRAVIEPSPLAAMLPND
jgi:Chemotaxis phosphatase CheX